MRRVALLRKFTDNFSHISLVTICLLAVTVGAGFGADQVTLVGNHPQQSAGMVSTGNADPNLPLEMAIRLKLRNTSELDKLLAQLQDPASPVYHKWLTGDEFDARFGPQPSDIKTVTDWLKSEGFTIESSSRDGYIRFSGNVGQAQTAFAVRIASYNAGAGYANVEDPSVPAQFGSLVGAVTGLDNLMRVKPADWHRAAPTKADTAKLQTLAFNQSATAAAIVTPSELARIPSDNLATAPTFSIGNVTAFGPADMRTFYDESVEGGSDGSGSCIALVGISEISGAALGAFDGRFHLPGIRLATVAASKGPTRTHDGNEVEAELDVEWSHAVAPGATQKLYVASPRSGDPLAEDIAAAVKDNKCGAISISFSYCGAPAVEFTQVLDPMFQKAAAQGQSVFVSAGDDGASALDGGCNPDGNRGVNEMSADPYVTSVGGTQAYPEYDSKGNATGYAQEQTWNSGAGDGATGGGASEVFGKPSYQAGVPGVPNDGARDVPDVALIASPLDPGVFLGDAALVKHAGLICCIGGTSLSAPMMAGLVTVIDQQIGERLGALNPILYSLGNMQYGSDHSDMGFHDITSGNNSLDGVNGYNAATAYDQTTGLGSVDFEVFAQAVAGNLPPVTTTLTPAPAIVNFGNVDATGIGTPHKIVFANKGVELASLGTVSVPADFAMVEGSDHCSNAVIKPKKSCFVELRFTPSVQGGVSESLTIPYNGGADSPVTVAVSGNGTPATLNAPAATAFAATAAGADSKPKTITIANLSATATVQMSTAALSGPFDPSSDNCSSAALGPKKHCTVTLVFAPPADAASGSMLSGSLGFSYTYGANSGAVSTGLTGSTK